MNQQQPGWATPQQDPEPGAPQPKRKRSIGKLLGFWLLGALGLFIVLGIIGSLTDSGKKADSSSDAKPSAIVHASKPAKAAVASEPSKSAKPSKVAKPSETPKATKSSAAPKPATAQARKKAAAILMKEDQDFRSFLIQGENVTGTPEFTAWYQKAIAGLDMQQTAFSKADAYFTADNEPTDLLEQWRSDNGDANAKITQYAMDGTSPDAPDAQTRKDVADARAALAKADKDAEKIANGS